MGLGPWEAFHQGIARLTGLQLGTVSILLGIPILARVVPARRAAGRRDGHQHRAHRHGDQRRRSGSCPPFTGQPQQLLAMLAGVVTIAIGSGLYLASDLGPGPRDGLMTGLHFRFGWSIRRSRTVVEISVLILGFLMGGTVGLGTVVFALGHRPLVQAMLRVFDREGRVSKRRRAMLEARGSTLGE